ncbi:uncharacterized protein K452DRAFT_346780 [Aplosporella prunicola CBS 121167]|uniref:Uncharacterized protein n=1 Tax=Aplosporella prunicola CBS 121167 TaxID=1176127 RepID=A0A6A6AWN1_9PEZI|nr:uncharacterized protein K452DRAFT_346780 [Aplosporella prunicola CBS 121167]KAF2135668.1 hypothetical protein K452DRAFT_346780 [Aplosporella prunicola CBS 121167]
MLSDDELPDIEWQNAPEESDSSFKASISYVQSRFDHKPIPEEWITQIPRSFQKNSKNRKSYISFGSKGTTASVNAYGHIMQISRYLGYGRSGFFSADIEGTKMPYLVDARKRDLMDHVKDPSKGFRLDLSGVFAGLEDCERCTPSVAFLHDCWPLFKTQQGHEHQANQDRKAYQLHHQIQTTNKPHFTKLYIQYFCHHGTIFQRYNLEFDEAANSEPQLDKLRIDTRICIRNLDFVQETKFNHDSVSNPDFKPGPNNRSLIIYRRISRSVAQDMGIDETDYSSDAGPKSVALIITPFAKGNAQRVKESGDDWYIELDEDARKEIKALRKLDITLAYRLQLLERDQKWRNSFISGEDMGSMREEILETLPSTFKKILFSRNEQLDFTTRRNLEHILSVCSVPVLEAPTFGHAVQVNASLAVALTCGDISGHRIASRASFSAFIFLHSMLEYLSNHSNQSLRSYLMDTTKCGCLDHQERCIECIHVQGHLNTLCGRIRNTLKGHVKWIYSKAKSHEGSFCPHYWPTGECITQWGYLPPLSLVDTPMQLLKVFWYYSNIFRDYSEDYKDIQVHLQEGLRPKIRPWISRLDKTNARGTYAFSVNPKELSEKFKLIDHVLICLAIKCVEFLGLENEMDLTSDLSCGEDLGSPSIFNTYCFEEVKRNILQRFTVQGPITKRWIIVTRRTLNESRFLFHSKDTILFHIMNLYFEESEKEPHKGEKKAHKGEKKDLKVVHFFQEEAKVSQKQRKGSQAVGKALKYVDSRWKRTVEAQAYHDEYQNLDWEKPLWYALTFILGCQGVRTNKLPIERTMELTAGALLSGCSINGLFAGLLDEDEEPIPFQNEMYQDNFWNAAFETPYVLWTYGREFFDNQWAKEHGHCNRSSTGFDNPDGVKGTLLASNTGESAIPLKAMERIGQIITKSEPFVNFSTLVDPSSLVEVMDDWLQNSPAALRFGLRPSFTRPLNVERKGLGKILDRGLQSYDRSELQKSDTSWRGIVIDIPKKTKEKRKKQCTSNSEKSCHPGLGSQPVNNGKILESLGIRRTVQFAKKRIVWLPHGDEVTALLCYYASPDAERENISHFFKRHAKHEKYFFDGATAILNQWETEIHLSFFKLAKEEDAPKILQRIESGISTLSFLRLGEGKDNSSDLGEKALFLRATMSFRFVGDFFDRFWTCHFLDHGQGEPRSLLSRLSEFQHTALEDPKKKAWQQRKVFELLLLYEMLDEMHSNTEYIFDWVSKQVLKPPKLEDFTSKIGNGLKTVRIPQDELVLEASRPLNSLAEAIRGGYQLLKQGTSDNYYSIIGNWRLYGQILQALEDDLSENIERISQWNRRDDDRKLEKPRWTTKDEKKYRAAISKMTVLNDRRIREITRLRASIKAFRESLPERLDSIRSDISFRGSENTNLFTYVTVVFLPLGFATGIFSMNNAPSGHVLAGMIVLALVALVITVFALANAKTTGKTLVLPVFSAFRCIKDLFMNQLGLIIPMVKSDFHPLFSIILFTVRLLFSITTFILKVTFYVLYRFVLFPVRDGYRRKMGGHKYWLQDLVQEGLENVRKTMSTMLKFDPVEKAENHHRQQVERTPTANSPLEFSTNEKEADGMRGLFRRRRSGKGLTDVERGRIPSVTLSTERRRSI